MHCSNALSFSMLMSHPHVPRANVSRVHYASSVVSVVLENSNVAKLASTQYLAVYTLLQEDCYDTDDASAREIYPILVPESRLCTVQSSRRRQHRPSVVERNAQAYRTAALYGMRSGVLGTGGHLDGLQQAPRRHAYTAGEMSAMGRL